MKKVIALALALTLALSMGSVAFAAYNDHTPVVPKYQGNDLFIANSDSYLLNIDPIDTARLYPGEIYSLSLEFFIRAALGEHSDIRIEQITSVNAVWKKGGALISSMSLRNKGLNTAYVEMKINENYTITDPKEIEAEVTFKYKVSGPDGIGSSTHTAKFNLYGLVGNEIVEDTGSSKRADAEDFPIDALDNIVYKCTDAGYFAFNSDTGLLATVVKMAKDEKAFMYASEEMIGAVEDNYGHLNAQINCYQFVGRPTFQNPAEFSLQADYADQYDIYEWDGKNLSRQDYTWNSIEGVYEWSTKSPKAYVISDKDLLPPAD